MDQYVEATAHYPNAVFSCVAHSNGTYLVAKALEANPACRFNRIVFAGSVVRRNYAWQKLLDSGRVKAVLNYVATSDWVVAWFPKLFEYLRIQDLGSAGHDGFNRTSSERLGHEENWQEMRFIRGGHSAALKEENWDDIAHFILGRAAGEDKRALWSRKQRLWVRIPGLFPPIVWTGIVAFLLWLGSIIYNGLPNDVARTLALTAYVAILWAIVTRF